MMILHMYDMEPMEPSCELPVTSSAYYMPFISSSRCLSTHIAVTA